MLRLSRESNPGPPALQANTLCKEPLERRISSHLESQLVLLQLPPKLRWGIVAECDSDACSLRVEIARIFKRLCTGDPYYVPYTLLLIS